jgi:hypothetical protein
MLHKVGMLWVAKSIGKAGKRRVLIIDVGTPRSGPTAKKWGELNIGLSRLCSLF